MENNAILFVIAVSIAACADGRVFYLENLDGAQSNDMIYPIADPQQASRDLDLAFSAGENPAESLVSPTKKVYTVIAPEKPYIELSRDRAPFAYYRLAEPAAARRSSLDDVVLVPQGGRKLMKLNNKGEVILELRVIANHDSS